MMIYGLLRFALAILQEFGNRSAHFARIAFFLILVRFVNYQVILRKRNHLIISSPISSEVFHTTLKYLKILLAVDVDRNAVAASL